MKTKKKAFPKGWKLIITAVWSILILSLLIIPIETIKERDKFYPPDVVNITVFRASAQETDKEPLVTASGFIIDTNCMPSLIAISRDLLGKYPFGTIVKIDQPDINKFYGKYFVVLDLMNSRYSNTVDILIDENNLINKWDNVLIYKYELNKTILEKAEKL